MLVDYAWRSPVLDFEPMPQQYRMGGMMSVWRRGFVLGDPGTGKTLSALWAADYLFRAGLVKRVLVVTMKSIMRPAWVSDIREHLRNWDVSVIHSDDARRRRNLARQPTAVHIASYQTCQTCHDELASNSYDLVVIDESTQIKNVRTARWRYLWPIVERAKYAWELTGTATAQSPMDAYGQVKLLYGDRWNVSEREFEAATMTKVGEHRWVPNNGANDIVFAAMQPAISVRKRDVMQWMPETTRRDVEVDLSPSQQALIKQLKKEAVALLQSGVEITAVHKAALRTKIVQIASGVVLDADRNPHETDYTPRFTELLRWVQEARALDDDVTKPVWNKVIVLAAFKNVVERITRDLQAAGVKAAFVHGGVALAQRNAMLDKAVFNATRDVEVVVAVPDVMSHGLSLTAANLLIWFTPIDKNEYVMQAEERMARPGQRNPMQLVRLIGSPAEARIFADNTTRRDNYEGFVGQYQQLVAML
jgi:SNF2 family DNA or RNA helicase